MADIGPSPLDLARYRLVQECDLGPDQAVTIRVPKKILDMVDAFVEKEFSPGLSDHDQVFILGAIQFIRRQEEYNASPEGQEEAAELRRQFNEACDKDD